MTDRQTLQWPTLPPPFDRALREAVAFVMARFDVSGIIAGGSIVEGNFHTNSDLDIYVIHRRSQRQRIQKRFEGVPAEIFVNPPSSVRRYFRDERDGPCTANMLVTGFAVVDRDPVVQELRDEAQEWLRRGPGLAADQLTLLRYLAADAYENAKDIAESDSANASMILHMAVQSMLQYHFLSSGRYLPRAKQFLVVLEQVDERVGALARDYYLAAESDARFVLAEQIAHHTIQATGFFEWESQPEYVEP